MTVADQLSRFGPYLGRVLEDEYIQEQLGQAITGLRRSSRRAKGQSANEALKDRRLWSQLRDAVNSMLEAASALQGKPASHKRLLPAVLLAAASAVAVLAWRAKSTNNHQTAW